MERILIISAISFIFALFMPAIASEQSSISTLITIQHNKYQNCVKVFNVDNVTLYYMTVAAINANKFEVEEIQSGAGNILFKAVNKEFLATVSNVNTNQAILRITPVDNNYYFQPGIVSNIFKFIDMNMSKKIQNIL